MANRKRNTTASLRTLLIVTATEAEAIFFSQMRKDCRFANLTVVNSNATSLKALINFTARERSRKKYDVAFALFGFNDVNTNIEEVKEMEEACKTRHISLCYFNPSFELWIYLHLGKPQSFIANPEAFTKELSAKIPGYSMSPEYLLTKGLNFHLTLFPRHAQADLNARDYTRTAYQATGFKATSMPELNAAITEICGQADMSHNTKVFK